MKLPSQSAFVLVALGAHLPSLALAGEPAGASGAAQAQHAQVTLARAVAPSPVQAQPANPSAGGVHAPRTVEPKPVAPPSPTPGASLNSPRMTNFSASLNGFQFVNTFKNDFIPAVDAHTSGLCGGMVYTALDYFNAHMAIPNQDYRPADKTPLHSYI